MYNSVELSQNAYRVITHIAECLLDISFIVDYSGSIRDTNPPGIDNWQYIINFMVNLVSSINVGDDTTHVGAVSFGTQLQIFLLQSFCVVVDCVWFL